MIYEQQKLFLSTRGYIRPNKRMPKPSLIGSILSFPQPIISEEQSGKGGGGTISKEVNINFTLTGSSHAKECENATSTANHSEKAENKAKIVYPTMACPFTNYTQFLHLSRIFLN